MKERGRRGPSSQVGLRMPSQPEWCWRPVGTIGLDDGGSWEAPGGDSGHVHRL